jgi:hypothetical protein
MELVEQQNGIASGHGLWLAHRRRAAAAVAAASVLVLVAVTWSVAPSARAEATVGGIASYPGGAPAAGIEVYISPQPPPTSSYTTKEALTDANGRWSFGPLTPGEYVASFVVFNASGSNEIQATQRFSVVEGEQASLTTSLSGPPELGAGTLSGTLTDSEGKPAGSARVTLTSSVGFGVPPMSIEPDGSFRAVLIAGTYNLSFSREDTEADSAGPETLNLTVTVSAGETSTVAYTLLALPPLAVPPGTTAANTARDLGYLNRERQRWGLPGSLTANLVWSQACAAHDAYVAANPNALAEGISPHTELPERAGYSPGGTWAGEHSVLAAGSSGWGPEANPWEDAPIHLNQLLSPDIFQLGIDESGGRACATTWPGVGLPALPVGTVLTYPGQWHHRLSAYGGCKRVAIRARKLRRAAAGNDHRPGAIRL